MDIQIKWKKQGVDMANVKKCDGCGIISPNEKGIHIANGWLNVYVRIPTSHERTERTFDLCPLCFGEDKLAEIDDKKGFPIWKKK